VKPLHISDLPYYAVIFTSTRTDVMHDYSETNALLELSAKEIPGFLGQEAVRDRLGIAVSYWRDLQSIETWRKNLQHQSAKMRGIKEWYTHYSIRICKVESHNYFSKW
jgi:heme-degrading monooxygenase HmoA